MKKVTKHYAFAVEDAEKAKIPLVYAKAVVEALRRRGLDIKLETEEVPFKHGWDDTMTIVRITASFVPDDDLIEKVGA